jgi:hypothetical protein
MAKLLARLPAARSSPGFLSQHCTQGANPLGKNIDEDKRDLRINKNIKYMKIANIILKTPFFLGMTTFFGNSHE